MCTRCRRISRHSEGRGAIGSRKRQKLELEEPEHDPQQHSIGNENHDPHNNEQSQPAREPYRRAPARNSGGGRIERAPWL